MARGVPSRSFNLCRSYRYQSLGYYVSLLAEARGHKPLPRVSTMEDLQSQNLVRLLTENLDDLVQKSLAPHQVGRIRAQHLFRPQRGDAPRSP